jgi:hypothetical protein
MLDITALAAWGKFIGGIAVVVSLKPGGQIRQDSRLLRSSTSAVAMESANAVNRLLAEHPDSARVYWARLADCSSLSESDRQRFDPMVSMSVGAFDQQYDFLQDGMMSERVWRRRKLGMTWLQRVNPMAVED